jgi:hypothetical protein
MAKFIIKENDQVDTDDTNMQNIVTVNCSSEIKDRKSLYQP